MRITNFSSEEEKVVKEFQTKFYETYGYTPVVLPPDYKKKPRETPIITLDQLHEVFEPYRPNRLGKKISLRGKDRYREIVDLRIIFAFLATELGYTLEEIGKSLGNRDHSSIIHYIKTFNNVIETSEPFQKLYSIIINILKSKYYRNDELSTMVYFNKIQCQPEPAVLP